MIGFDFLSVLFKDEYVRGCSIVLFISGVWWVGSIDAVIMSYCLFLALDVSVMLFCYLWLWDDRWLNRLLLDMDDFIFGLFGGNNIHLGSRNRNGWFMIERWCIGYMLINCLMSIILLPLFHLFDLIDLFHHLHPSQISIKLLLLLILLVDSTDTFESHVKIYPLLRGGVREG